MRELLYRFTKNKEYGFLLVQLKTNPDKFFPPAEYEYLVYNDLHLIHSKVNEYGQPVQKIENDDCIIIFDGKLYKYYNNLNDPFLFQFSKDLLKKPEHILNTIDAEFSLLLIDKKQKRILIARDKLGYESCFYANINDHLIICNRFHHYKHIGGLEFNPLGIGFQMTFNTIPPPCTYFKNIFSLPAGYYASFDYRIEKKLNKIHTRYWDLPPIDQHAGEKELFENMENVFIADINKRRNKDINPILYSGGLDSSVILFGLKRNVDIKKIHPYFFYFKEYPPQEVFLKPVEKVCKEFGFPLSIIDAGETALKKFEYIMETMHYTQLTYYSADIFDYITKKIRENYGKGISYFTGEAADGLFGVNATDESGYLKFPNISWSQFIINMNYSDTNKFHVNFPYNVIAGLLGPFLSLKNKKIKKYLNLYGGMKNKYSMPDVIMSSYFSSTRTPCIEREMMYNPLMSDELNEEMLAFFYNEYIEPYRKYYERDGIGGVSKLLSYRLEVEGQDMKIKMIGKFNGIRPEFPHLDGEFMKACYIIPNKFYRVNENQRPKYPLRVLGERLSLPLYILDQKKWFKIPKGQNYKIRGEDDFIDHLKQYMGNKKLLKYIDKKIFKNNQIPDSLFDTGIYSFGNSNIRFLFALEKLANDYQLK